jgi:hypothetical protein
VKYKIKNKIWIWPGESANWHFFIIPPEVAGVISKKYHGLKRGFGSLPVSVSATSELGEKAKFETSIFPYKKTGAYFLPLKKSVRRELGVQDGDILEVSLEIKE